MLQKAFSSPEVVAWMLLKRNARPYRASISTVFSASVIHGRIESKTSTADLVPVYVVFTTSLLK